MKTPAPAPRLILFESTWADVDRARAAVAAARLEHRISIHHVSAKAYIPAPPAPQVLAKAG